MILDLSSRERHAAIRSFKIAIAAIDLVPARRRPSADKEAIARLLQRLRVSERESAVYGRSAEGILHEVIAGRSGAPTPADCSESPSASLWL